MRKYTIKYIVLLFFITVITSCSLLPKKRYSNYSHAKKTAIPKTEKEVTAKNEIEKENEAKIDLDVTQEVSKDLVPLVSIDTNKCDIIVLKDGNEIEAHVLEINSTEIKYTKCHTSKPMIAIAKSDVFMIKYENGMKDVITPSESNSNTPQNTKNNNNQRNNNSSNSNASNGDSELKLNAWALWGLILVIASLGTLAPITVWMSVAGIQQIGKHPEIYKGKGIAWTGWSISMLVLIIGLAALLLV